MGLFFRQHINQGQSSDFQSKTYILVCKNGCLIINPNDKKYSHQLYTSKAQVQ